MSEYKTTCPRCGGEVRIASIKCKHCDEHYDIDKPLVHDSSNQNEKLKTDYLKWLVVLTIISGVAFYYAVVGFVFENLTFLLPMVFAIPILSFLSWRMKQGSKRHLSILSSVVLLFIDLYLLLRF